MIKLIISVALGFILFTGNNLFACEGDVAEKSREALRRYIEISSTTKQDRTAFGKVVASTLMAAANCDSTPLPVSLDNRRGYYQGIFIMMQYAGGVENAASRPDLKVIESNYERLIKLQKENKRSE